VRPAAGTVGFVRLESNVDDFVEHLEADYDTVVVPGRFFGAPDHFRLGYGMEESILKEGLLRLDSALAKLG
jgi:aspartate/methionine/tyrosine aminotransferase